MLEMKLKAFDTVLEWSKQIVTLAAALLILSTTFIRNVVPDPAKMDAGGFLTAAWIILLVSVLFGICVMGGLASSLNKAKDDKELDVFVAPIRGMSMIQFVLFFLGIILFMVFVFCNM